MALARIELPDEPWSTRQALATRLRALGYRVDLWGSGEAWVLLLS